MMQRSVMSKKSMEWICSCLKEASKEQQKEIRRWKFSEQGWLDITSKIERFIKCHRKEDIPFYRVTEDNYPEDLKEKPTLADIRKWVSANWKKVFGVNIYELNRETFLFEFPNRYMVEQTIQGQWRWKNNRFQLDCWSPTTGCIPHTTSNDERNLPREVSISCDGIKYYFPIWVESKPRFELLPKNGRETAGEEDEAFCLVNDFTQGTKAAYNCNTVQKTLFRDFGTTQHVGSVLTAGMSSASGSHEQHVYFLNEKLDLGLIQKPKNHKMFKGSKGPDYAAQVIFNDLQGGKPDQSKAQKEQDFAYYIEAMQTIITVAPEKSTYVNVVTMISEDENRGTAMATGKEIHHYNDKNGIGSST
ncbi:hypothetical protein MTR67_027835 [Solanum verrucosum]|uniref:DUF4283 domain-containing protein n=1 Tax=Solanum verrucosum TaxID=315347 RepID=A0AAF0TZR0_SOLVR|nr:hypothetical protein MTR67_027835 [Solanum verrucosum]